MGSRSCVRCKQQVVSSTRKRTFGEVCAIFVSNWWHMLDQARCYLFMSSALLVHVLNEWWLLCRHEKHEGDRRLYAGVKRYSLVVYLVQDNTTHQLCISCVWSILWFEILHNDCLLLCTSSRFVLSVFVQISTKNVFWWKKIYLEKGQSLCEYVLHAGTACCPLSLDTILHVLYIPVFHAFTNVFRRGWASHDTQIYIFIYIHTYIYMQYIHTYTYQEGLNRPWCPLPAICLLLCDILWALALSCSRSR
jgi:hypothetical protein